MWIERDISDKLRTAARQRPAVVLTGARQAGKTSLLRHLFPDHRFVSLDLPSVAQEAEQEPDSFLARYLPPLVVDEVQYAPGLFRHLKRAIDADRDRVGQFILTGSQKFVLMREVSDSLAGRASVLELDPLSLHEIRTYSSALKLEDAILRGGYPELYRQPSLESADFYRSYVTSYLERDLRLQLNVTHLRDFERFLRACALRTGQLLNKAELARDVGISPSTANQWLSVLEACNQIALLEPWFSNGSKSMLKSPKLYFCDTGVLLFLLNIQTWAQLASSPLNGPVWETFVFIELRKRLTLQNERDSLFFWRDRQVEVDFLIHRGGTFELLEAKWGELMTPREAKQLSAVAEILGRDKVKRQRIICRTSHPHPVTREVTADSVDSL